MIKYKIILVILVSWNSGLKAQKSPVWTAEQNLIIKSIEANTAQYERMAKDIWDWAEMGYKEYKSSSLLQNALTSAGFNVESGVAGMPTAFVASYGQGHPIIGILAEFDALPGVNQDAVPYLKERSDCTSGHACGHNLFGVGSVSAAIAVKEWLASQKGAGTIRLYGTPAEEGGSGKVYMVRAGLFDDVDAVLHWHAGSMNTAGAGSCLAVKSATFKFYGVASHAAGSPERGRSALDGVEALNYMVNMMREHVPQETRLHYVITKGGQAPNVVPAYAEVYYYVRHPQMQEVKAIFERMVQAAKGAAMGTETRVEYEIDGGSYNLLPNEALARVMHKNLEHVGGVVYNEAEKKFAEELMPTLNKPGLKVEDASKVMPFIVTEEAGPYSTDVGDVSWMVPTTGLSTATWVPGTSAHSWQAVAAGGMSIGYKGMHNAAKIMALTTIDLFKNPTVLTQAKKELLTRRGNDFKYEALLGNREVPLNYRDK